jgi:hypothetical protein
VGFAKDPHGVSHRCGEEHLRSADRRGDLWRQAAGMGFPAQSDRLPPGVTPDPIGAGPVAGGAAVKTPGNVCGLGPAMKTTSGLRLGFH